MLTNLNPPPRPLHMVYSNPTIIIGMSVSNGSPGRDVPFVAAVFCPLESQIVIFYGKTRYLVCISFYY